MASVLLGNRLRRQIRLKVWPVLRGAGFGEFGTLHAYRRGTNTIDVVEFVTYRPEWQEPRWLGGEIYANGGTFELHIGTYFTDIELLPGEESRPSPKSQHCHRCTRLSHGVEDSEVDGRTFWPGVKGEQLEAIVDAAVHALCSRGVDYLDHYRDLARWIAAHEKGEACHPGHQEPGSLSAEESAEAMRFVREGRQACAALKQLHTRLHLADEHLTAPTPCERVLAAHLMRQGREIEALAFLQKEPA